MEVLLLNVRLGFAQYIFEKGAIQAGQKSRFSCKAIFPLDHPAVKLLDAAEAAVAKEKWGAKADTILNVIRKSNDATYHDGDLKPEWDGFEGNLYVNAANDKRPNIWDRDRTALAAGDGRPYGGCFVNMTVDVWAQDNQYGKKINADLTGIQFVRDGDSFGSGAAPAAAEQFPDLGVDDAEHDPLLD